MELTPSISSKQAVVAGAVLLGIFFMLLQRGVSDSREPFASVETRFGDRSASGMRIIPASCPSQPDVPSGECSMPSNTPPELPPIYCEIVADTYSINQGEAVTLAWQAAPYNYPGGGVAYYYDPSLGIDYTPTFTLTTGGYYGSGTAVGRIGSVVVYPTQTTTYTIAIHGADSYYSYERSCDATITVSACTPQYSCVGNGVLNSCSGQVTACTGGYECVSGQCQPACNVGYTLSLAPGTPTFTNVDKTAMRVNWTAAPVASSYKLERCTGASCSDFVQIASGLVNPRYSDSGLSAGTTYRYRVRGTSVIGDTPYSGIGTRKTAD